MIPAGTKGIQTNHLSEIVAQTFFTVPTVCLVDRAATG
jgi:hypothetical protein